METNTEDQRQSVDLQFLQGVLNDHEIATHFAEKSEEYALSFLSVEVSKEIIPQDTYVQMMYIPSASVMDETNLLQFFAFLPEDLPQISDDVKTLISYLNTRTPYGYFAPDQEGKIFYRYVYALPRFDVPNKDVFIEVFNLFVGTLAFYGKAITQLAKGELSLEQAKNQVES